MQMASFFELHFILAGRSFGLESNNNLAWRWHSYYRLTIGRIYFTTPFEMGKAEGTKSARENNALGFFRHGPFLMVIYEDIHTRRMCKPRFWDTTTHIQKSWFVGYVPCMTSNSILFYWHQYDVSFCNMYYGAWKKHTLWMKAKC